MNQYLLIFLTALLLSGMLTPAARRAATRLNVVYAPNARTVHRVPMPMLGGIAMYGAFLVALLAFGSRAEVMQLVGILMGASVALITGLIDDIRPLRPLQKLLGLTGSAAIVVASGISVEIFTLTAANVVLSLLWIVGLANAINFLDNIDGLASGITAIAAAYFLLLSALNGQYLVGALCAALLGASIGFLFYNVHPASLIMGDAGALFLGVVLACVGIKLRFHNTYLVTWMIPPLVLLVPIFDTTLVTVSRLRRRVNPFTTAGKDHLSHRLVALGMTTRESVLVCWLIGALAGMVAVFFTQATVLSAWIVAGLLTAASSYAIYWLEWKAPVVR